MHSGRHLVSCLRQAATRKVEMTKFTLGNRKLATLPRLPVPVLKETLSKYLLSVRPLLTPQEYAETEKVVQKFGEPGGVGQKLHYMLEERAKQHVNWLSDWWLKCAYLTFREPVVVFSSPGLVMPEEKFKNQEDQLKFASRLIVASLNFKGLVDRNELPQDTSAGAPLDMSQYERILGTCRIPKLGCDELQLNPNSKHIVVARNNNFFKVNVYGEDGHPLNEGQIMSQLKMVVQQSDTKNDPVGILSSEHRDTWAKMYKRLCSNPKNLESVGEIEKSLFLVCLDKQGTRREDENSLTRCALQTIHGDGVNSGNRWFDKTLQYLVAEDGSVGLTYEHSPSEGPPVAAIVDYAIRYIEQNRAKPSPQSSNAPPPQRLEFQISDEMRADIQEASRDLDVLIKDLEMNCFQFEPFGKDFIKSNKLSPDSVIQMSLQLAFYRLNGCLPATYESASTRMFELGRTETIRSASIEALKFCETMKSKPLHVDAAQKAQALREAVAAHKAYTTAANRGLGVDRVLLGLKLTAVENGVNVPDIFLDAAYTVSSHFRLSTSQVAARCKAVMGYGPVVPDGYGCCYNPHPESIYFGVSAWNTSPATDAKKFSGAIEQSLVDIHNVLVASKPAKL